MNYIELIGPPGIGKTTLLNTLAQLRKEEAWKTYNEAISNITDSLVWNQLNSSKSRLLYLVNKANFTGHKKRGICNSLVKELVPQIAGVIYKKYEYLAEAQLQAIQTLSPQISSIIKCSFVSWHMQALQKLFLLESFGYNSTVLLAEGPLKNHHGLNQVAHDKITPNTLPNAIIYCHLSIAKNIERIQNRFALTGRVSTIHNTLNSGQIEELVSYSHEIAKANLGVIKMLGIPVYEIALTNATTDTELYKLQQFIAKNSSTKLSYQLQYV